MALRTILTWPNPELKKKAAPVTEFNAQLKQLVQDLFETMYHASGVGLAATQIGVHQQVLVIDLNPPNPDVPADEHNERLKELQAEGYTGPIAIINPQIIQGNGKLTWEEGCLSVPGIFETVTRKQTLELQAQNVEGQTFTLQATGFFAVALQHEIDHLHGIVFVEHLSKLKRDVITRKMSKYAPPPLSTPTGSFTITPAHISHDHEKL